MALKFNSRIRDLQDYLNLLLINRKIANDGRLGRETLRAFMEVFKVNEIQTIHAFANMHHESGEFTILTESLYYTTVSQLMKIFGKPRHSAAITLAEAPSYLRNEYKLAERVYGIQNKKLSAELGNKFVGDGYKFRGRWALQCTGRADFERYGKQLGLNLVDDPDKYNKEAYFLTALAELEYKKTWLLMKDLEPETIKKVRIRINGGTNGLKEVEELIIFYQKLIK